MIKSYLRQALAQMRLHRLYSAVCIVGTALPIMMTMVVCLVLYIRFAPIYPETHRDTELIVSYMCAYPKGETDQRGSTNYGTSYYMVSDLLPQLPHCQLVCGTRGMGTLTSRLLGTASTGVADGAELVAVLADGAFWRMFDFDFVCGHPFTQEQVDANEHVAVITEELAQKLFASTDVAGRKFTTMQGDFTVCGVVRPASMATLELCGNIYVPIFLGFFDDDRTGNNLQGAVCCYMLPKDGDREALRQEVRDMMDRINATTEGNNNYSIFQQPDTHFQHQLRDWRDCDTTGFVRMVVFLLLLVVLIPTLNLSGMIASRMDERMAEIGVRKAYGASNASLLWQVVAENMLLSVIGGVVGLLLSYGIVWRGIDILLWSFGYKPFGVEGTVQITPEMFLNPAIFGVLFLFIMFVNLVSAIVPTVVALRRPIVNCLTGS